MTNNKEKVLVLYMPVIHTGYIKLLKQYNQIYIISDEILKKWDFYPVLQRDLRKVDEKVILKIVQQLYPSHTIKLLSVDNINEIQNPEKHIIMPNDDISKWVHKEFLKDSSVEFINTFLRWDNTKAKLKEEPIPDTLISHDKFDRDIINKAELISANSANWWRQVGAILIKDKEIILSAYNKHVPTQYNIEVYGDLRMEFNAGEHHELSNSIHAEAALIATAAKLGIKLDGADIYVSTFPCPTCAKLIVQAGIKRVYFKTGYSLSDALNVLKASEVKIIQVN